MNNCHKKYYIFTPADTCSGGPEALHQLAYYMRGVGMEAYTVYYTYAGFPVSHAIERYRQYEVEVEAYDKIEDVESNYVIAPENAPWCLNGFKNAQKCIWWLSAAFTEVKLGTLREKFFYHKRKVLGQNVSNYRNVAYDLRTCWHLCGSKFAFEETKKKYPNSNIVYLVEPISLDFLRIGNTDLSSEREDVVLYNPSKPSAIMTELLERARFNYVPLKGYTPKELAERYKKSKLYVDFGHFKGPERMPKEAVYFGCNILVSNHNAAANDFDVAIPQKYKVDDGETADQIEQRIADMLANYDKQNADFKPFKVKVEKLEDGFLKQMKGLFQ